MIRLLKISLVYALRFGIFLMLFGCLTQITFDLENQERSYAVSGQVSTVPHRNTVQVSQTNGVISRPLPVGGAAVTLFDDQGNVYTYQPSSLTGVFELPGFSAIPGRAYYIEVNIFEGGFYRSRPERMPLEKALDNTYYEFEERPYSDGEGSVRNGRFINIFSKPSIPSTTNPLYLKWSVDELYIIVPTDFPDPFGMIPPSCYVTQGADPQRTVLYNSLENARPPDEGMLIASRIVDNTFHTKHYFMTYVSSMTPEALDYWRKVNVLVNQVGSIFDTPPATIKGNMEKGAASSPDIYGYFQAVNEDYHKFSLTRFELPYPFLPHCEYDTRKTLSEYSYECLDCIDVPNSTYLEPDLWD